jgi:hypothetical protein
MDARTIEAQWSSDDADRKPTLDRARLCASLSLPWILPDEGHEEDQRHPDNYQSIGSKGVSNMASIATVSMFPGGPWFQLALNESILYDPTEPEENKTAASNYLLLLQLWMQARLEGAGIALKHNRMHPGFRTVMLGQMKQVLATGDALIRLDDDYRLTPFRRDMYVTRRDMDGAVVYHITKQEIDPLALTEEERDRVQLHESWLEGKTYKERKQPLFTRVEWHPQSKKWVISQEVNKRSVRDDYEERICPLITMSYHLTVGENYGRGVIEENLGDMKTLDDLELRILDFAEIASRHMIATGHDADSVPDSEFAQKTGSRIRGLDVNNGVIRNAAFLKVDKVNDFTVVLQATQRKREDLGKAMLLGSETIRDAERVTAREVGENIRELQGATGGMFIPLADSVQGQLVRRMLFQVQKNNEVALPQWIEKFVDIRPLTGMAALSRQQEIQDVLNVTQIATQLGPEAIQKLNVGLLIEKLLQYQGHYIPDLVRSDEQLAEMRQQHMQEALAMSAGEKAVEVAGNAAQESTSA